MRKSSLLIIFMIVFIDLVGFGIVIPILPYYAQSFGASAWELGLLMAVYSAMQFLFSPVWGRISDRVGRRPVLLLSLLGSGLSLTYLGFAHSLVALFVGRTFAGVFGANISTAYAYVADITTSQDRAKGMGIIGAGFGLGFIFGPAIGGLLSRYGYSAPMFAGAALAFVNVLFAYFRLAEPALSPEAREENRAKRFDRASISMALSDARSRVATIQFFFVTFAVTQMEVIFAIYLAYRFGFGAERAGMLLAVMGVIMALVQGGLIRRLAPRFGESRLIIAGTAICAVALVGFSLSPIASLFLVSLCALAFGHGLLHPSLSSLASLGAHPSRRGITMGVFQSASSLARVAGPPVAGILYDRVDPRAPFFAAALVLAVCSLTMISWARRHRQMTRQSQPGS